MGSWLLPEMPVRASRKARFSAMTEILAGFRRDKVINENLARRAKENMSFSNYKEGSATAEFNATVAEVAAKIETAKARVSPKAQERLDNLLSRYMSKYAKWTNAKNANGASHVSVMVSGPANYNMRAHEKHLRREGKLWEEYEWFKNIDHHISRIVRGDKIIKTGASDEIEKLEKKVANLVKLQEDMKAVNKILRNKRLTDAEKVKQIISIGFSEGASQDLLAGDFAGRVGFPSYALKNNNANIRRYKQRLEKAKKLAEVAESTPTEERTTEVNGIKIFDNIESNRLQIFFPDKPSAEVRTQLKKNGFRWAPSIGAWQSYRSERANAIAQEVAKNY